MDVLDHAPAQARLSGREAPAVAETLRSLCARVVEARRLGGALRLRGSGSKDFYGEMARGEVLDVRQHRGVVRYDPSELVLTARAGTTLRELETLLAEHGQMLAFEPPHFGPEATLGGMLACGLSGPRRASSGAVRDYVLGLTLISPKGEILRFGGEVMKNVAGYDISRLVIGSMGSLGLIAEASIKVWPVPAASETLWFSVDAALAIDLCNRWAAEPWPMTASAWIDGHLVLRMEGARAAVAQATRHWQQEHGARFLTSAQALQFWDDLKEHRLAFFGAVRSAGRALWRISVPSATPHQSHWGDTIIEWGGAQRWVLTAPGDAQVRAQAKSLGGHATLFRALDKRHPVFTPLEGPMLALQQRIRREFDPGALFNPGRFMPTLDADLRASA